MLKLKDGEQVIVVVHRHWFVMASTVFTFILLLGIPPFALLVLPYLKQHFDPLAVESITNFALVIYVMVILVLLYIQWMDYHLDMWIITNLRIIDVEQFGLFNRQVSEIPLSRVQDVTIEMRGFVQTFLRFGTIRIQTAGGRDFNISSIPHLYEIKDAILKHSNLLHAREAPNHKTHI